MHGLRRARPTASTTRRAAQRRGRPERQAATTRSDRDRGEQEGEHPVAELDGAVDRRARRAGRNDASVQRGQVGQPSPEPVSRTTPPVTTIAMLTTSDGDAAARPQPGGRRRGEPVGRAVTVTPT